MPLTYSQTQSLARYRERKKRSLNQYQAPEASASITAQYMRDIRKLATQVTKLVIKHVLPVLEEYESFYSDAGTQQDVDLGAALSNAFLAIEIALRDQSKRLDTYTREAATKAFTSGNKFHRRKWVKEINKLAGVDVRSILNETPVEALLLDKIDENVNLIKTVQPQYLGQVKEAVTEGLQRGDDFFSIKNRLKEIQGTNEKYRPNLIARDQMNKLTGALDQIRQEDIGIDSYVWRTSRDQNVRTSHKANENETFQWAAPPPTGHPGQDIGCRCTAEPNLPKWFSKLEERRNWDPGELPKVPKKLPRRGPALRLPAQRPALRNVVKKPRSGELISLDIEQQHADQLGRFIKNDIRKLDMLTDSERERVLQWNWVHGSNRKMSVGLKQAIQKEFKSKGLVRNIRGFDIKPSDIKAMRKDVRRIYEATQKELKKRGASSIRLYRGVTKDIVTSGVVESWTSDPNVARQFGSKVLVRDVPVEKIFNYKGSSNWIDGIWGNQKEFMVIGD